VNRDGLALIWSPRSSAFRLLEIMPIDDPNTWMQGAAAVKAAFDGIRSAISTIKDIRGLGGGSEQQQKAIDTALATATNNTAIAEAALGQAFGYQLCKCEFPPIPMRTVGYVSANLANGMKPGDPVYECPKCGYSNVGPFTYQRLQPRRP
jgi:hypothetical protein